MKFNIYPGYTAIGIVVENDESKVSEEYTDLNEIYDMDKRIKVRIPEIHGVPPELYDGDLLSNVVDDNDLPWIKASIPPGFSSDYKKQLYPKGYSVYVRFPTGDINHALVDGADYTKNNIAIGSNTLTGGPVSPVVASFISTNAGNWGIPLVDETTGEKISGLYISSGYGWRSIDGGSNFHRGIDLVNGETYEKLVFSTRDGNVIDTCTSYGPMEYKSGVFGNYVLIDHGQVGMDGYSQKLSVYTIYAHLAEVHVSVGDTVKGVVSSTTSGSIKSIGRVGSSGHSTGPHLHFEMRLMSSQRTGMSPDDYNTVDTSKLLVDCKGNKL